MAHTACWETANHENTARCRVGAVKDACVLCVLRFGVSRIADPSTAATRRLHLAHLAYFSRGIKPSGTVGPCSDRWSGPCSCPTPNHVRCHPPVRPSVPATQSSHVWCRLPNRPSTPVTQSSHVWCRLPNRAQHPSCPVHSRWQSTEYDSAGRGRVCRVSWEIAQTRGKLPPAPPAAGGRRVPSPRLATFRCGACGREG